MVHDALQATILRQPFGCGLGSYLWHAGNIIRRVSYQSQVIDNLLRINLEFYQTFAEAFAGTRRRLQPGALRAIHSVSDQASVLDLGCGSGILAITAAKRGASRVVAVDHDEQALEATGSNARLNHVPHVSTAQDLPSGTFDLVLANIVANTLVDLAPRVARLCAAGAQVLLSGILESQTTRVWTAYAPSFHSPSTRVKEGWVAMSAARSEK